MLLSSMLLSVTKQIPKTSQCESSLFVHIMKHLWDGDNLIIEVKMSQIKQLPKRLWDTGNLISVDVKSFQIGQLPERIRDEGNLIVI